VYRYDANLDLRLHSTLCAFVCVWTSRYTGKERDTESGLDYFGARYYASSMGRWMSPDWADKPEAVPYSSLDNPQTLNLYGYVGNNPLSRADADGHVWQWLQKLWNVVSYPGIMNDPKLSPAQRDAAMKQAWADHDAAGKELVTTSIQLIGVVAEAESPMGAPPTLAEPAAPTSPDIHPSEISGKSPSEIDATATGKGLIPKGPDPMNGKGSYVDPVTGQQRVLSHPDADPPHAHVNNPAGERLGPNGQVVPNESPEAHLPIKKDPPQ
jgi:RHS repeat-associated protein